jgi:hypothetical protein
METVPAVDLSEVLGVELYHCEWGNNQYTIYTHRIDDDLAMGQISTGKGDIMLLTVPAPLRNYLGEQSRLAQIPSNRTVVLNDYTKMLFD